MDTNYPTLRKAALHILYDNGMINRFTTEDAELTAAMARAARVANPAELSTVEAELAALSDQQLYELCCDAGEPASELAEKVLNALFEE